MADAADLAALDDLVARCTAVDGVPPVNDQALVEVRRGERTLVRDGDAIAVVERGEHPEVELAVLPESRGRGLGTRLASAIADAHPGFEAWAHGDLPAARAIAERLGMRPVRSLLQLRAPVPDGAASRGAAGTASVQSVAAPGSSDDGGVGIRAFTEPDADAWVAVNAAAFSGHPEQGSLTLADLADRRAERWHDDANLLVADGGDGLDGYAWVKPGDDVAELYALGVAPAAQGTGLGGRLLAAAFGRMAALGARTAHLYVEADNEPALALYRSRGFTLYRADVRWADVRGRHVH